jgi:hypothetical protein
MTVFQASLLCLLWPPIDNDKRNKTQVSSEDMNVVFISNIFVSRMARKKWKLTTEKYEDHYKSIAQYLKKKSILILDLYYLYNMLTHL